MASEPVYLSPGWTHFLGGPVPYDHDSEHAEPVDPFTWLNEHGWPRKRPTGPRPALTPEEHAEAPFPPAERQRRAVLLARLREVNRPYR